MTAAVVDSAVDALLAPALAWSGYLRRRVQAHPALADWLTQAACAPVSVARVQGWHQELFVEAESPENLENPNNANSTNSVAACRLRLRRLRERVFSALMVRDVAGLADVAEVVTATTALAELAIEQAYRVTAQALARVHGVPRDDQGRPQEMLLVGMGKLGGGELNVSSDIDLVLLYAKDGQTEGARPISHHEFYCKLAQRMMPLLSEPDAHGHVFRTDLRLRPDGDSGPAAWSLAALGRYFIEQGREWERYAWLKARLLPVHAFEGSYARPAWQQLEGLRTPFVYRNYFDFDALAALRELRARIRLDWERRAQARGAGAAQHNIKLGEGGIREIEFVVQLGQLIRGGRRPALQMRGLLPALHAQREAKLISADVAQALEAAYLFLRRVEHRLQYREDEQTHLLPRDTAGQAQLAAAMGMATDDFTRTLQAHREFVHQQFRDAFRLLGLSAAQAPAACATQQLATELAPRVSASAPAASEPPRTEPAFEAPLKAPLEPPLEPALADAPELQQRLAHLRSSPRLRGLPALSRQRFEALLPATLTAARQTDAPLATALRLLDFIEAIAPRSAYLALLSEYPETLARLARMMAASAWAAHYLTRHPLLLDALIDWRTLYEPLDMTRVAEQLRRDLDACLLADGTPDIERQMNLMRDAQRQTSFQLLAQDLEGQLGVEALADQLSALADLLLAETLARVWPLARRGALGDDAAPRFAIIAYGKLGGKELGYNSDLDLVFLYDDARPDAADVYARLARRMLSWLSTMTSSGRLYETDLRLRPDGNAGLLAVSVAAFAHYQREHAWPWEHQALTRARYCAGDAQIGAQFDAIRRDILLRAREAEPLAEEVRAMRARILAGHPNASGQFDLKHDRGGMVDVEFITQYLVLCHARQHPALLENLGNITLLKLLGEAGIIPAALAQAASNAYRSLRHHQHRLRLQGAEQARVDADELLSERAAVTALWETVLGAA